MNLAKIITNDIADSDTGIATSLWFNGCCFRCKGCHNSQLWDAVNVVPNDMVVQLLIDNLTSHGVQRNLSILGGEPLMNENRADCAYIIEKVKETFPDIKIYVWTGFKMDVLKTMEDKSIKYILDTVDTIVDGQYEDDKRRVSLKLRGSTNQNIYKRNLETGGLELVTK